MDIKVNSINTPNLVSETKAPENADGSFKFMLASNIAESELQEKMTSLMSEISELGDKISKKKDIRDMKKYRGLIKEFMNEVVNRSHEFKRENFLDRRGRHRVYGIIKLVDQTLDELAQELCKDEKDNMAILAKIGDIRGLLLDILM